MNTSDYLLADADASAVALVDGERTFTYGQLRSAVEHLASELTERTAVGDRVGLMARNSFFWVAAYLACMHAGRAAVPFPTTVTVPEGRRQAEWVGATTFFAERAQLRRFASMFDGFTVLDDTALVVADDAQQWLPRNVDPDDDAVFQLTSGTTSAPKAVRVTHGNIQANTASIVEYLRLRSSDRILVVLPFSYCFGASLLQTHLRVGGSVALCHTMTFPETVVEALERHRCTGFAGVPSTYQLLLRASSLPSRRVPTLRYLQQAGGKLATSLIDQLVAAQPQAEVFVMYGQTEATSRLSYLPPTEIERRRGSIGRGIPGVRLRVVDEHDRDVAVGEVGEVVAEGPNVTKGYWNDPASTAERYRDGRLRTGDLATVDEDGFIYIVDRAADFIKSWGFRVSSQEIEEAVLAMDGVIAAAAVGVPDEVAGEAIVLFLVAGDAGPADDEVLARLRATLAKHMVPSQVRRVDEFPLNSNGKVVKAQLRDLALTATVVT